MFLSWKVVFGKSLSKLSCVYLPLEKLVNGKHFPVKEKFGLVSRKMFSLLAVFVFRKVISGKPLSKLSCVCLPLEKLVNRKHFPVNRKHFPVKGKFGLVFRKVFFFYFGRKTLSKSCEKFRNIILFADYIKFGSQTFDCYIYFVLYICFSISSLKI